MGMDAIVKGEETYAQTCFHHWQLLNDCLPLRPLRSFQAIMGPSCDASRDFQKRAIEEFAEPWDMLFRAGKWDPSMLPICGSDSNDPDVELLCRE
jgi:hypothetical protein